MAQADTPNPSGETSASKGIAEAVAKAIESDPNEDTRGPDAAQRDTADKAQMQEFKPTRTAPVKAQAPKDATRKAKATAKPAAKRAASKNIAATTNSTQDRKEPTMATATKTDTNHTATMATDMQERMQDAYGKATEFASEAGEFSTANLEAMVESGKVFFDGAQNIMRDQVETGKSAIETMTQDAKAIASVKSPTEFMQLQGEMTRRNFDAMISQGSKHTEAWVKLYNDAFAPISNRVSVASERMTKAA